MIYGYIRCSTMDQGNGSSPEDQERRIQGVAMMRGDGDPVMVRDIGISGSVHLSKRPNGATMMASLQKGDVLIAAKLDRLFRSAADALTTVEGLSEKGVKVILSDMGSEPVTENGMAKMFFTMLAAVAEFERWRINERTADGRKGKAARGGHIGGDVPYGFTKQGRGRDAVLTPNQDEAAVVALVKELAPTHGPSAISDALYRAGLRNRVGNPFHRQQVKRIMERVAS